MRVREKTLDSCVRALTRKPAKKREEAGKPYKDRYDLQASADSSTATRSLLIWLERRGGAALPLTVGPDAFRKYAGRTRSREKNGVPPVPAVATPNGL